MVPRENNQSNLSLQSCYINKNERHFLLVMFTDRLHHHYLWPTGKYGPRCLINLGFSLKSTTDSQKKASYDRDESEAYYKRDRKITSQFILAKQQDTFNNKICIAKLLTAPPDPLWTNQKEASSIAGRQLHRSKHQCNTVQRTKGNIRLSNILPTGLLIIHPQIS